MKRTVIILSILLACVVSFYAGAQTTFTANINLRNLVWTSTVDQATANQERNTDAAYFLFQIGRQDMIQKDANGAYVLNANGDLKLDPALTNAQVSSVIVEYLAADFKNLSDAGAIAFQTAKTGNAISTTRKAKPQP
ncbi:MAG TPA: hypothetical protein VEF04_20490 [Blastocatellia bacterium]|nr:hypothetical protein [Blastocatellia bacterium]